MGGWGYPRRGVLDTPTPPPRRRFKRPALSHSRMRPYRSPPLPRRTVSALPKKRPVRLKSFPFRNTSRSWVSKRNLLLAVAFIAIVILACVHDNASTTETHKRRLGVEALEDLKYLKGDTQFFKTKGFHCIGSWSVYHAEMSESNTPVDKPRTLFVGRVHQDLILLFCKMTGT